MRVITISRSYGSAGSLFGRKLADRLGFRYMDEAAIGRMKTDKEGTAALMMTLEDEISPGFVDRFSELVQNRSYFKTALTVGVYSLVLKRDAIVVGGGGHLILQGYPMKVSLQIYRNLFDRVQDIARDKGIGQDQALDLIEKKDKEKKKFVSYYFDADLFDPIAFDITFNASKVSLDDALDLTESYCRRYFERIDPEKAEKFARSRLLENRAQLALFHLNLMQSGKISFEAPEPDVVVVSGVIGGLEDKERVLKALRNLKGVNNVVDKLKTGILSRMLY